MKTKLLVNGKNDTISQMVWIGLPDRLYMLQCDIENNPELLSQYDCYSMCMTYHPGLTNERSFGSNFKGEVLEWEWQKVADNFSWSIGNSNSIVFQPYHTGPMAFRGRIRNSCGWSAWRTFIINVFDCESKSLGYFIISPNPSFTYLSITPHTSNTTAKTATPTFNRVMVTDTRGNVKINQQISDTASYRLDIRHLANGIYSLQLLSGTKIIEQKTIQVNK